MLDTKNKNEQYSGNLQELFDNMLNAFAYHKIVTDKNNKPIDYIFLEVNKAFEEFTGLKKEEIIGQPVTIAIPGIDKDPADWIKVYGEVAQTGKSMVFENFSEPLNKWYSISAYSPKPEYFATIFEDITEKKKSELALQKKSEEIAAQNEELEAQNEEFVALNEELKSTIEQLTETNQKLKENEDLLTRMSSTAKIGGWDFDVETSQVIWTHEVARILGVNQRENIGLDFGLSFYLPESKEKLTKALNETLTHGTPYNLDLEIKNALGDILWVRTIGHPIKEGSKVVKVVGSFQDITEIKKAEINLSKYKNQLEDLVKERTKELEDKNKELEEFNQLFVGREFRINELKERIKDLENQVGKNDN